MLPRGCWKLRKWRFVLGVSILFVSGSIVIWPQDSIESTIVMAESASFFYFYAGALDSGILS
ncbi:hypothetical protein BDW66DRAFT_52317 [Aspergillus desertorum]